MNFWQMAFSMETIDNGQLEVHIFGGGEGESIVLKLPNGHWGVVDCFASNLENPETNESLTFLRKRGVASLEFLCMTHPHKDHFRGMSQFLDAFEIKSFWRPEGMSGQRLGWILESEEYDAGRSGEPRQAENAEELFKIFAMVSKQRVASAGQKRLLLQHGTTMKLFSISTEPSLEIWALAPSAKQSERYEGFLAKCFDDEGRYRKTAKPPDHNVISMALLVVFGATRIVLGGDVKSAGWRDVLDELNVHELSAHLVKVSHHGSENGYCEGLWAKFAEKRGPISVVTPYRSPRLPREGAIRHIERFSSRVLTPCIEALHPHEIPVHGCINVKSRLLLRTKLKATQAGPFETGRCSFVFDSEDNCIEESLTSSAGDL